MDDDRNDAVPGLPACSLGEVAWRAGGTVAGGEDTIPVRGLSLDSRHTLAGQIFVALPGDRVDGHDFLEQVWAKGATALVHRLPEGRRGPCVLVEDSLRGLQRWAESDLQRAPARVCGITGSVGKTSIKEMCAAVLATGFRVHRTRQNRNGQIGVAATVLERPPGTEVLVLEMGISLPGEMDRIVRIAPPEVAVLNRLSPVHLANFERYEDLVAEKRKLLLGAPGRPPRLCVVHADVLHAVEPLSARVTSFGLSQGATVHGTEPSLEAGPDAARPISRLQVRGLGPEPLELRLPLLGRAMAENALAALTVGSAFGLAGGPMLDALAQVRIDAPMRQEWHSRGGLSWINDAYNASPASMLAALELLALYPGASRRIAVLGDMLELGPESVELHRALAGPVARTADLLYTFGPQSTALGRAATIPAESFQDIEALSSRLLEVLRPGDLVLLKASRGIRLERLELALETCASRFAAQSR